MFILGEDLKEGTATIVFSAQNLIDEDWIGKSDTFFRMFKETANGQWDSEYTSEIIENNHNPKWKPFRISIQKEDYERRVKVKVYDHDSHTRNDEIGSFIASMRQLKEGTIFQLTTSGQIRVERFNVAS